MSKLVKYNERLSYNFLYRLLMGWIDIQDMNTNSYIIKYLCLVNLEPLPSPPPPTHTIIDH